MRERFDYLSVGVDAVEGRLFGEEEGVRLQIMVRRGLFVFLKTKGVNAPSGRR